MWRLNTTNKELGIWKKSWELPQCFIDAQNSTRDCCAVCLARWDIDMVTGYVWCENPESPNRQTSCAPTSKCDKFQK